MAVTKEIAVRQFETGATRSAETGKYDYEGFLHPVVIEAFGAYMHVNRELLDGSYRESDNWQKGIPLASYIKSLWRHFHDLWKAHRGIPPAEGELAATMGILFNSMGYALERMKIDPEWFDRELAKYKDYRRKELEARVKA